MRVDQKLFFALVMASVRVFVLVLRTTSEEPFNQLVDIRNETVFILKLVPAVPTLEPTISIAVNVIKSRHDLPILEDAYHFAL